MKKREKYNIIKRVTSDSMVFKYERPILLTTLIKKAIKERLLFGGLPYVIMNSENNKEKTIILGR